MKYDHYGELLRRTRTGDLRKAEIRSDWPGFAPALVLTFNGGVQKAVRHTSWLPFLKEHYVRNALGPDMTDWAMRLAMNARR